MLTVAMLAFGAETIPSLAATYTEKILYNFAGQGDGGFPQGGLARDSAGNLYGTTNDAAIGRGTVFELSPSGVLTTLYSFTGGNDGGNPIAGPILAGHDLYGTTQQGGAYGGGVAYKLDLTTGKIRTLRAFHGDDGVEPWSPLIRDSSGNLFGTTNNGGAGNNGVVFKLSRSGYYTVLYAFTGRSDGGHPVGSLIEDSAGNLYGTTEGGNTNGINSYGSVFKISPAGVESTLYSFPSPVASTGSLALDKAGNLYGTTEFGGNVSCYYGEGCGTIFEISASGSYAELHDFDGTDGQQPYAGLILKSGNLFGTTDSGGAYGLGTVFQLNIASGALTDLHDFAGPTSDGESPSYGNLIRDRAGNLYGVTDFGGPNYCPVENNFGYYCGIVFELSPGGK